MEFSRIGEHTIKCTITEQEISDLGYTVEDILSNGERTQEFMNRIFDLAEKEFQTKFDLGIKTVRADFMSDHTLSLTFSEHPASGMVEHLKDIIGGLIGSFAKEKMGDFSQALAKAKGELPEEQDEQSEEKIRVYAIFTFDSLEIVNAYAKRIDLTVLPENALYKWEDKYVMIIDLSHCTEEEVRRLSVLTDEYASKVEVGAQRRAFLMEHAKCVIKEQAIEQLQML